MSKHYGSAEQLALDSAETGSSASSNKNVQARVSVYEAGDVDAPPLAPGAPVEKVSCNMDLGDYGFVLIQSPTT